jgi:small-conductance mechanosensitive channel
MLFDILAAAAEAPYTPFAFEILERTASAPRVQQVVQLSLAPAFLLSGIGAVMNVIMSRMIWIAQRIDKLEDKLEEHRSAKHSRELAWLVRRRKLTQGAILFSTAAAVIISIVIGLLFISAYITAQIGTLIAGLWVLTMALLVTGLLFFLRETRLAASGAQVAKDQS